MAQAFIGEIRMFGFNFAPQGWLQCNGQLLPISQNVALFSLIGTFYGGNGTTTFALPNLQSCVPIHQGQGPGLSPYVIGQTGGTENVTLLQTQMPDHTHTLNASTNEAVTDVPTGGVLAAGLAYTPGASNTAMGATAVSGTGGSQPHTNLQPYLTVNFCIATVGIFPSRN
jgi:microcystin-dependent protein